MVQNRARVATRENTANTCFAVAIQGDTANVAKNWGIYPFRDIPHLAMLAMFSLQHCQSANLAIMAELAMLAMLAIT